MLQCFISYSRSDTVLVQLWVEKLPQDQFKVWIDYNSIKGGTAWEDEISKGIEESQACLVCITPEAVASEWVKREIELAQKAEKPIIPLIMRPVEMPKDLEMLGIANIQVIHFVRDGFRVGMQQLLDALQYRFHGTKRALIIEDVPEIQEKIRKVFQSLRIESMIAGDYDEASSLIEQTDVHFDVVTLDMQLDIMDTTGQSGRNLLDHLHIYRPDTKIIIVSALTFGDTAVRDFLVKLGAHDFIKKETPFNVRQLHESIQHLVGLN